MKKLSLVFLFATSTSFADVPTKVSFPDGIKNCNLKSLQYANTNLTVEVVDCLLNTAPSIPNLPVVQQPSTSTPTILGKIVQFDLNPNKNRYFIPGCLDGRDFKTTDCEFEGSAKNGQIYSLRFRLNPNSTKRFKIDRAETGENSSEFYGAVSTVLGVLTSNNPLCNLKPPGQTVFIADPISETGSQITNTFITLTSMSCVLPANTDLYLNFTANNLDCGKSINCRAQLVE